MNAGSLIRLVLAFSDRLKYRKSFLIVVALLAVNIFIPDFVPLLDELILGCIAALLATFKKKKLEDKREEGVHENGVTVEGEIVEDEDEK